MEILMYVVIAILLGLVIVVYILNPTDKKARRGLKYTYQANTETTKKLYELAQELGYARSEGKWIKLRRRTNK